MPTLVPFPKFWVFPDQLRPLDSWFKGGLRRAWVRRLDELTIRDESAIGLRPRWSLHRCEFEFVSAGESRTLVLDAQEGRCRLTDARPKASSRPRHRIGADEVVLMMYHSTLRAAQGLQSSLKRKDTRQSAGSGGRTSAWTPESVEHELRKLTPKKSWDGDCPFEVYKDADQRVMIRARRHPKSDLLRYTQWRAEGFMEGHAKPETVALAVMAARVCVSEKTLGRILAALLAPPRPEVIVNRPRSPY
jgi:hypothetical protein